jgi:hypothetical protein
MAEAVLALVAVVQVGAVVPEEVRTWPDVPAAENPVVPTADWYGTAPATPAAKFEAVVALVAEAIVVVYANAEPLQDRTLPVTVGAAINAVVATVD